MRGCDSKQFYCTNHNCTETCIFNDQSTRLNEVGKFILHLNRSWSVYLECYNETVLTTCNSNGSWPPDIPCPTSATTGKQRKNQRVKIKNINRIADLKMSKKRRSNLILLVKL